MAKLKSKTFLRAIDVLNLSYVAIIGILVFIFRKHQSNWRFFFVLHIALFTGLYAFYRHTASSRSRFIRFLRDLATPLLLIFYYEETESLNHLITHHYLDPFFAHVEEVIFRCQPALLFAQVIPSPIFSEYMHLSYFFYYLLIPILWVPLWFGRRHKEFDIFIFTVLLNMTFCYAFFICVPCAGPWHYFAEQSFRGHFPGYLFVSIMDIILKYGEIANGAFPSSHVAMATVILLCAWRYKRIIFWITLPMVLSLYVSTVYTQAHYLIDIPAGFIVGVFFFLISERVKVWLEKTFRLRKSDDD